MFPKELTVALPGLRWRTILRHKSGLKISVRTCRHLWPPATHKHWVIEYHGNENESVTLLALLDSTNSAFERLVLLPRLPFDRKVAIGPRDTELRAGVPVSELSEFLTVLEEMRIRRQTKFAA